MKKYRVTIREYRDLVIEVQAPNSAKAEGLANLSYLDGRRHLFEEADKGFSTKVVKVRDDE
jgi:hypothetical protein